MTRLEGCTKATWSHRSASSELIAGFNLSGTIKAVMAGAFLSVIGSIIAGIPAPFDPLRLARLLIVIVITSFGVDQPHVSHDGARGRSAVATARPSGCSTPCCIFRAALSTRSKGFPLGCRRSRRLTFTYAVHAFKSLLLKNTGMESHRCRSGVPEPLFDCGDDGSDAPVQADAVGAHHEWDRPRDATTTHSGSRAAVCPARSSRRSPSGRFAATRTPTSHAINYHFRDKRGLYREVLQMAVGVMCEVTEAAQQAGARSAEEKLRVFIHLFLQRLVDEGNDVWLQRLINREIVDPTPTVDALEVITEQAVRPRIEFPLQGGRRPHEVPRNRRSRARVRHQHSGPMFDGLAQPDSRSGAAPHRDAG